MENINKFIEYCKSFYFGDNALYPLQNVSHIDFVYACNLVARRADMEFAADSFDRERVRDILESVGFKQAI
jgi:hypothetical protein